MPDLLSEFKHETGMQQGLDADGSLMVVVPRLEANEAGGVKTPPVVMLAPVRDYGAFVGNFGGNAGQAVTNLALPDGRAGFAKKLGGYAVMSDRREAVEAYEQQADAARKLAEAAGLQGRHYLGEGDVVVLVNFRNAPVELLMRSLRTATEQLPGLGAGMGAMPPGAVGADAQQGLEAMERLLRQMDAFVISVDFGERGLGITMAAQSKAGTNLAAAIGQGPGDERFQQMLARLPGRPYLAAASADFANMDPGVLFDEIMGLMPDEGPFKPLLEQIRTARPLLTGMRSMAQVTFAPDQQAMMGMGGMGSMFTSVTVIEADEPQGYLTSMRQYIEKFNGMKIEVPAPPGGAGMGGGAGPGGGQGPMAMTMVTGYQPNVLQIEGQSVDQYEVRMQMPPQMMAQMGPMAAMMGMTAQQGYVTRQGEYVIQTQGLDANILRQAVSAVKQTKGLGVDGMIPQLRPIVLPPGANGEFYFDINPLAQMASGLAAAFGGQPFDVPQNMPPIAGGMGVRDHGIAMRMFVPTEVMRFVGEVVGQLQGMQGGMPGGPQGRPRDPNAPPPAPVF
jgi:hypothetical protein